jgi:hypothetical protein
MRGPPAPGKAEDVMPDFLPFLADHTHFQTINQIQLLDVPGDVTQGEILR